VTSLNRSDFNYAVAVVSAAIASLFLICFLVLAVLSPDINVNFPGGSQCKGAECIRGGGGGGD